MQVFRNAVIPSSNSLRAKSPPLIAPAPPPPAPARGLHVFSVFLVPLTDIVLIGGGGGGGRPPPDYGPYQGPGGGRRR